MNFLKWEILTNKDYQNMCHEIMFNRSELENLRLAHQSLLEEREADQQDARRTGEDTERSMSK